MAKMTREEVDAACNYFAEELNEPKAGYEHKLWYDNLSREDRDYYNKAFAANEALLVEESMMSEKDYYAFLDKMIDFLQETDYSHQSNSYM